MSLALVEAARSSSGPVLVVAPSARDADRLERELRFFAGEALPVVAFPDWETLPYDVFSPHQDIVSGRLKALNRLPTLERGLVVIALGTLLQRLPPTEYVAARTLLVDRGHSMDLDGLRRRLEASGYSCVSQVVAHGEFAVRGSLIDIFPTGTGQPYRIDLFDDEVDTIRGFDPDTQLSSGKVDGIRVLPAREFPLTAEAIKDFRRRFRARFEGNPTRVPLYRDVSAGLAPGGIEYYLPLFFPTTGTLFEYLPPGTVVATLDDFEALSETAWGEILERYEQRRHDPERPLLEPREVFLTPDEAAGSLAPLPRICVGRFELEPAASVGEWTNFATAAPPRLLFDSRSAEPARRLVDFLESYSGRVLLVAESAGRREALRELLQAHGIRASVLSGWDSFATGTLALGITEAPLESGLALREPALMVIADEQLYGDRVRREQHRRRRAVRDPEAIIRELTDLATGAPVVHEDYGVGRYLGLVTLEIQGLTTEFLSLEYAGGDKLYVPVHALHLISRYTGASPEHAPLHRLGGDQWQKTKRRAAKRIRDVAAELLDLYARRMARAGHAFAPAEQEYRAFAADFPFDPTPDQAQAIEEVLQDMSATRPMDRIVCGDVGFGKTEVALRAAFTAALDGKQVAVLVPTTLLAQQHFDTFTYRFADWPVRVEMLSRFRSRKQVEEILTQLARGTIDILIGTHRLLQDDVQFSELGLAIIDEEHRFGVRHKEKLKSLRAAADVLTLTATPIPRTLNMALGGLREMSLIATPPEERLAIKTFVSEWNGPLVREACVREIKRGGQVFFVHNEVRSIKRAARELAELVPEATVEIGHGQMRERDLERVMRDFYHQRFNVLVCSTIIESGIDIPTTNTIIINRADKFGLAQLHQLRGRVGRSHHRAYAYLITPHRSVLTADALKRLEAIESLEDLGAGFTLATHDLEIRGAGELLGEEQTGQIHELGFALYMELLERAVQALKEGREPDLDQPLEHGPEVELRLPALLPENYIPDVHMRLILYKRIANAANSEALRELQVEMIDRFGLLPPPTRTLFRVAELKLKAQPLGIRKIEAGPSGGRIVFAEQTSVEPGTILQLVQQQPDTYRLTGEHRLRFQLELVKEEDRIAGVSALLDRLAKTDGAQRAAS